LALIALFILWRKKKRNARTQSRLAADGDPNKDVATGTWDKSELPAENQDRIYENVVPPIPLASKPVYTLTPQLPELSREEELKRRVELEGNQQSAELP
jgi:hypothetical protein